MQPSQDPEKLRHLMEVLKRQLAAHRVSPNRTLTWVLEEARILDTLIMVQMQLETVLREKE